MTPEEVKSKVDQVKAHLEKEYRYMSDKATDEQKAAFEESIAQHYASGDYALAVAIKEQLKQATPISIKPMPHGFSKIYGDEIYLKNLPAGLSQALIEKLYRYNDVYQTAATLFTIEDQAAVTGLIENKAIGRDNEHIFKTATGLIFNQPTDSHIFDATDNTGRKREIFVNAGVESFQTSIGTFHDMDSCFAELPAFGPVGKASLAAMAVREFEVSDFVASVITEESVRAAFSKLCADTPVSA